MKKGLFLLIASGCLLFGAMSRDNKNEIVIDSDTGLMWQDNIYRRVTQVMDDGKGHTTWTKNVATKDPANSVDSHIWNLSCPSSDLGGYNDWRVPNKNELISIIDVSNSGAAINGAFKRYISKGGYYGTTVYWSSTSYVMNKDEAWVLYPASGFISTQSKTEKATNTICVRGPDATVVKKELQDDVAGNEVTVVTDAQ